MVRIPGSLVNFKPTVIRSSAGDSVSGSDYPGGSLREPVL
jgi:hypothetical protein